MVTDWWKVAVDSAQIVSAIATTAAVIVSLTLARRNEKQRPKIVIGFNQTVTVGSEYSDGSQSYDVTATVVNAGLLPFWIKSTHLYIPRKSLGWFCGGRGNVELLHGRQEIQYIRITDEKHWQDSAAFLGWMPHKRPYYSVTTSLGRTYKARMTYKQVKVLKRMVQATVSGDFANVF